MRIPLRTAQRPASARVPLRPDLRTAEGGGMNRLTGDLPPHRAGSLAPMPIRRLPPPPESLSEWLAAGYASRSWSSRRG